MTKRRGHGEGSIYKRKDGRWTAVISLGERKRQSFYGKTRKEVKEKMDIALQERQSNKKAASKQLMKEYLTYWLNNVQIHVISETTYIKYESELRKHIIPALGHLQLDELTTQHIQTFMNDCIKKRLSSSMLHNMKALLGRALDDAVASGMVSLNVCRGVKLPTRKTEERVSFTLQQARTFLNVAKDHRYYGLFAIVVVLGLRSGEVRGLTWDQIDFDQNVLYVRYGAIYLPGRGTKLSSPKTEKGIRPIKMPPFLVRILLEHRDRQEREKEIAAELWEGKNLVFCTVTGGFLYAGNINYALRSLLLKAGLPSITFHDLRHSAATIMKALKVNDKVIQETLGHASFKSDEIYIHLIKEMVDEAVQKLEDTYGQEQ
jgi:integrase